MNDLKALRKAIITSLAGALVLVGTALVTNAQNRNEEYREWQAAQRRAQEEYRDYQRSRSRSDYRDWQQAQRRAQQEYNEYVRAGNRADNRFGNRGGFRLYRNGSYYVTDQRGVNLLRQAVRSGYSRGYREGQMDRRYGRGHDFYNNNLFRSGTYGYQSYVDRNQYQYYFQEGFRRGYEDGYYSTRRYGNNANILGNILNTIINLVDD